MTALSYVSQPSASCLQLVPALIARIPHSHRYTVTDHGLDTARFLTCVHDRFLPTGLAQLADHTPSPLRAASHAYNDALGNLSRTTGLAV